MKFKILLASLLVTVVSAPAIASTLTPRPILPQLPDRFCEGVRAVDGMGYYEFIDNMGQTEDTHKCKWKNAVRRAQLHHCGYSGLEKITCGR